MKVVVSTDGNIYKISGSSNGSPIEKFVTLLDNVEPSSGVDLIPGITTLPYPGEVMDYFYPNEEERTSDELFAYYFLNTGIVAIKKNNQLTPVIGDPAYTVNTAITGPFVRLGVTIPSTVQTSITYYIGFGNSAITGGIGGMLTLEVYRTTGKPSVRLLVNYVRQDGSSLKMLIDSISCGNMSNGQITLDELDRRYSSL